MKTYELKEASIFTKIAKMGGLSPNWDGETNLCHYVRSFLWGSIACLFIAGLVSFLTYCMGDFLGYVAACISLGTQLEPTIFAKTMTIILVISAFFGALILHLYFKEKRMEKRSKLIADGEIKPVKPKEPSFITLWYRSVKDKTCFKIKLQ